MLSIPEFNSDPKCLKEQSNLIQDAGGRNTFSSNVFLLFKPFKNKYYLIYGDFSNIIISYDISSNKIVNEETKTDEITSCFNHYPDVYNKRDF